jgi:hypothetical protein
MWLDPDQVEKDARRKRQARRLGEPVSDDSDVELDPSEGLSRTVIEIGDDEASRKRLREKDAWLALDVRVSRPNSVEERDRSSCPGPDATVMHPRPSPRRPCVRFVLSGLPCRKFSAAQLLHLVWLAVRVAG